MSDITDVPCAWILLIFHVVFLCFGCAILAGCVSDLINHRKEYEAWKKEQTYDH